MQQLIHFSDVSSAIRKEVYDKYPHSVDCIFAEDQEWAKRVLKVGYSLIYEPSSIICHSHNDSLKTTYKRAYAVGMFMHRVTKHSINPLYRVGLLLWCIANDIALLARQQLRPHNFLKWVFYAALQNIVGQLGSIAAVIAFRRTQKIPTNK